VSPLRRGKATLGVGAGIVIAAALAGLWLKGRASHGEMPNVLLITCDTFRADRLSLYGASRKTTPYLEELAKESVVFDAFFANSSFTPPSHASILTGTQVRTHGLLWWDHKLSGSVKTLGERLGTPLPTPEKPEPKGGVGYRTGAFVNLPNFETMGVSRGFQKLSVATWLPGREATRNFFAWLDDPKDTRRWCSWIHYWDPHRPFAYREWQWLDPRKSAAEIAAMPPREKQRTIDLLETSKRPPFSFHEETFGKHELGVGRMEQHYNRSGDLQRKSPLFVPTAAASRPFTDTDDRYLADRYDGGALEMDEVLRELVEGLRTRGELDKTLLIITSDHGETFTERADEWWTHDPHLYDEVTRVPCLIRFPQKRHGGARVSALSSSVDLLPTIYEVLGLRDSELQGTSLVARIGAAPDGSAAVYAQTQNRKEFLEDPARPKGPDNLGTWRTVGTKISIRTATHRLIFDRDAKSFELYDLRTDPGATRNLHSAPPSQVEQELSSRLLEWFKGLPAGAGTEAALDDAALETLRKNGYLR